MGCLELLRRVEDGLHQDDVARLHEVQPVGARRDRQQQHLDVRSVLWKTKEVNENVKLQPCLSQPQIIVLACLCNILALQIFTHSGQDCVPDISVNFHR